MGPDRSDERSTAEGLFIYDDTVGSHERTIDAARGRFELDHLAGRSEVSRVENPCRPGESAWRPGWD